MFQELSKDSVGLTEEVTKLGMATNKSSYYTIPMKNVLDFKILKSRAGINSKQLYKHSKQLMLIFSI
jgi:hypothetical protein